MISLTIHLMDEECQVFEFNSPDEVNIKIDELCDKGDLEIGVIKDKSGGSLSVFTAYKRIIYGNQWGFNL